MSVLLAGCLLLSLIPSMALAADTGHPFKDVASDAWCNEAVEFVYERGLMAGTSGTTFAPDATTTRGQSSQSSGDRMEVLTCQIEALLIGCF